MIAERLGGEAVLLPRIVPLGDLDEAEANLMFGDAGLPEDGSLPPEADPMMRRLTLAELVIAWSARVREAIVGGAGFLPKRLTDGIASDAQGFMVAGSARDALTSLTSGVGDVLISYENEAILARQNGEELDYIVPDHVHVMYDGRIVKSGDKSLALELEAKGYDWIKKELAASAA